MMPSSKEQCWGAGQPPRRHQARPTRCSWRMVAERNDSTIPVVVWVESAMGQPEQSPAFASAFQVEQELEEQQRKKAASLRRFQGEVKQRVNRQVRMHRRQELQKCYEAVERESCVAVHYSTPWKNTCLLQSVPTHVICGPGAASGPARLEEKHGEPFQQQNAELSKAVKQVRHRLASRRTRSPWRREVCDGLAKDSSLPEPPGRPHTEYQPPLILWAGVDQEETRKQRQSEFLRCRRLFMAMERDRVREQQRQRERQQRVAQIKREKENQRRAEEQKMRDMTEDRDSSPGEGTWEALAHLQLEERRVKDRQQRDKEHMRYVDALRAQMREKIKACNIDLPPLCSCGSDFWDSHPDTCANNCIFYKNHKAYSQVLHSVISSYAHAATRPLQDLAALCTRSGKRL